MYVNIMGYIEICILKISIESIDKSVIRPRGKSCYSGDKVGTMLVGSQRAEKCWCLGDIRQWPQQRQ